MPQLLTNVSSKGFLAHHLPARRQTLGRIRTARISCSQTKQPDAIVIGGGIAGLLSASVLSKRLDNVVLIEKDGFNGTVDGETFKDVCCVYYCSIIRTLQKLNCIYFFYRYCRLQDVAMACLTSTSPTSWSSEQCGLSTHCCPISVKR